MSADAGGHIETYRRFVMVVWRDSKEIYLRAGAPAGDRKWSEYTMPGRVIAAMFAALAREGEVVSYSLGEESYEYTRDTRTGRSTVTLPRWYQDVL